MAETEKKRRFNLLCVWCGAKIRETKEKDLEGTCLSCFYRILNERTQTWPKARPDQRLSER